MNQAGLHVFKHKKRILYISTVRPQLFDANQASISNGFSVILSTIRSYPKISRKQLAEKALAKLIGEKSTDDSSEEYQHAKTTLATDLIWLAKAGHVIEFADGTLDLPLPPRSLETKGGTRPSAHANSDGEEVESSADEESAIGQLETEEMPGGSEPELSSSANDGHKSEVAPEEVGASAESPVEPTAPESPSESALQLPNDAPVLLEEAPESLECVSSHSS